MLRIVPLLALACGVSEQEPLRPPPQSTLQLEMFGAPVPGQLFGYTLSGANPGETVYVVASNGGAGPDIGECPPFLGGNCMDMQPGTSGYVVLATGAADGSGTFERIAPFVAAAPDGVYQVQGITAGVDANESNVEQVVVDNQCPPDAYEPNDDQVDAFEVTGPISNGFLCDDEYDWFVYTVGPDGFIEITVDYPVADGDLDIELFSADGFLIDQSRRATGEEILAWYNFDTQPVDVFMRVVKFFDPDRDGIPYTSEYEVVQPNFCPEDAAEDDDDAASAQMVLSGDSISGASCANDLDWFSVPVGAGETLLVDVSSTGGTVELKLYDGSQSELLGGQTQSEIVYTSASAQDMYVSAELVTDSDAQPGANYQVDFTVALLEFCEDDSHEPDDDVSLATPVAAGVYADLAACEGSDPDWFTIDLVRGQTLDLAVDFSHAEADLDLYLFDPRGRLAGSSAGVTDQEVISHTATRNGSHTFYVAMYADEGQAVIGGGSYDLTVTLP